MQKYKTYKIENVPSDKFPDMVLVTKGKNFNKKFINETKAKIWIDELLALNLINKGSRKVKYELDSIGLISEVELAW